MAGLHHMAFSGLSDNADTVKEPEWARASSTNMVMNQNCSVQASLPPAQLQSHSLFRLLSRSYHCSGALASLCLDRQKLDPECQA